ncbi:BON domain-containing protein [Paraburkholderia sp. J10-1]|uniref:BON domain-containing protein n=1 Tax=Paraburkholderia sp. J10-1 TaxID=2805430 RepID=UPI002AB78C11|nr:BON domain-containing protein [Paraburkholderia sp. J10-1]
MALKKFAIIVVTMTALAAFNAQAQPADSSVPVAAASSAKAARKADHMLEKAVRKALGKDKAVDVTNLTVRARNGVVTLLGSVPEQGQVDAAAQAAQGVAGVLSVNNALTVKAVAH